MAQIHSYIASAPLLGVSSRKAIALGPMMAVERPVSRRGAMALGVLSFMPHVTSAEEEKPLVPGHWPIHVSKCTTENLSSLIFFFH